MCACEKIEVGGRAEGPFVKSKHEILSIQRYNIQSWDQCGGELVPSFQGRQGSLLGPSGQCPFRSRDCSCGRYSSRGARIRKTTDSGSNQEGEANRGHYMGQGSTAQEGIQTR
jgi:hypothetical protein